MWPESFKRAVGSPVASAIEGALRRTDLRAGVVLLYHRLTPVTGDPARELAPGIAVDLAERQMDHLRRVYRPLAADRLAEEVATREPGAPFPVAITFDDDNPEHLDAAVPILAGRELPATFFLCGPGHPPFWWETVNRALCGGVAVDRIAALLTAGGGTGPAAPLTVPELGLAFERLAPDRRASVAAQLDEISGPAAAGGPQSPGPTVLAGGLAAAGFDIGFHTLRHQRLTLLDDAGLDAAMREGLDALAEAAGKGIRAIAYPHGWADQRVADSARRAGFEVGFTAEPRAVTPGPDPLLIPRCDAFGFGPRLEGFELGIARRLLDAWLAQRRPRRR